MQRVLRTVFTTVISNILQIFEILIKRIHYEYWKSTSEENKATFIFLFTCEYT